MTIEDTLKIALEAHTGQKDIDGKPAILHPLAVALMGSNDTEIKAGLLHDAVEDSEYTIDSLREKGVEEEVLDALKLLSHDKASTGYFDYVSAIVNSGNETAINVKQNDLRHNLQRGQKTYEKALADGDTAKIKNMERINGKHIKALEMFNSLRIMRIDAEEQKHS